MEFFFANVMAKIYQIPMLFTESSEFGNNNYSGCFLVLIFGKTVKKRQAKPAMNKKVRTAENLRK